jgi:hypothetical protein
MCVVLTAWQVMESRKTAHAIVIMAGHMLDHFQILRVARVSRLQHLEQQKIDILTILLHVYVWRLSAVLAMEKVPSDSAGSIERGKARTTIFTDNTVSCRGSICSTSDPADSTVF